MEIIDIFSILGALISFISAFKAFRLIDSRLKIEKELKYELQTQLLEHKILLQKLEKAKNKEDIKIEVSQHIKDYENLIFVVIKNFPQEKQIKIYPAISQNSTKGKISYISKLLSGSLTNA